MGLEGNQDRIRMRSGWTARGRWRWSGIRIKSSGWIVVGFVLDLDESRLGSELESDHWDSDKMETESGLDWDELGRDGYWMWPEWASVAVGEEWSGNVTRPDEQLMNKRSWLFCSSPRWTSGDRYSVVYRHRPAEAGATTRHDTKPEFSDFFAPLNKFIKWWKTSAECDWGQK